MKISINHKIEKIYKEIGEFGFYQLLVILLIGFVSSIPVFAGFSFSFYGAVPNHRCAIPNWNDTYEIINDHHLSLIQKYIPLPKEKSFKNEYDKCHLKVYNTTHDNILLGNNLTFTIEKCNKWVFSRKYFESTLVTEWNLVCANSSKRQWFNTLYFLGSYGVLLNGILSDRYGRKKAIYFLIAQSIVYNIALNILLIIKMEDFNLQQILFGMTRLLTGMSSSIFSLIYVLGIEMCGTSKRILAYNLLNNIYISSQFLVASIAYFIRNFKILYTTYTSIIILFGLYFWAIPESPRWLMINNKSKKAYNVFKKIAKFNNKKINELSELENLRTGISLSNGSTYNENGLNEEEDKHLNDNEINDDKKPKQIPFSQAFKLFFKTKKIFIRSIILFLNWLTNVLVYYGLSFNTSDLVGDPYLNFFLSALVEVIAVFAVQLTVDRFGRKKPYVINMAIVGVSLLLIQFVPKNFAGLVTVLALIAKFSISFTYGAIFVITGEIYPTALRNSSFAVCQSIARTGGVIAPQIQALGDIIWFPIPFIFYGSFSAVSSITFMIFLPETKDKVLPDTIEDFVKSIE